MQNYQDHVVRAAAILTTSYVPGTVIGIDIDPKTGQDMNNVLVVYLDYTKGSLASLQVKVEFAPSLYYNLAYDGQSANFTVGKIVTGAQSGAKAFIVSDTDSGTSGTLVISRPWASLPNGSNLFFDNEIITDDNGTPGAAVVNDASFSLDTDISDYSFYQQTAEAVSSGTATLSPKEYTFAPSGNAKIRLDPITIKDRYIRISAKGTGTTTSSSLAITAVTGQTA
jgi:hypothetical protein